MFTLYGYYTQTDQIQYSADGFTYITVKQPAFLSITSNQFKEASVTYPTLFDLLKNYGIAGIIILVILWLIHNGHLTFRMIIRPKNKDDKDANLDE